MSTRTQPPAHGQPNLLLLRGPTLRNSVTPPRDNWGMNSPASTTAFKGVEMCDVGDGLLGAERESILCTGSALMRLAATDPAAMSREELAETVASLAAAAEQAAVMAGRFMDIGEQTAASLTKGERSMVALVNSRCHVSKRRATQLLRAGRIKHRFPTFHTALVEGRITTGHTDLIAALAKRVDSHQLAVSEKALAALAIVCTPEEFADSLAVWEAKADPTQHLDEFLRAQDSRNFSWARDLFGNIHIGGTLEPLAGEQVVNALEERVRELKTSTPGLKGVAAQHDALVDLILGDTVPNAHIEIIYPDTNGDGRLPEPPVEDHQPQPRLVPSELCSDDVSEATEFDLLVAEHEAELIARAQAELEAFRSWIGVDRSVKHPAPPVPTHRDPNFSSVLYPRTTAGTLIPPAIVAELGKTGRVRTHPINPDGHLSYDQPARRHFTTNQRRMIRLRDLNCQHPGCRTPAKRCDHDHIQASSQGGPTLVANGQLLCPLHHRWKHRHDPIGSDLFNDSPIQLE